ncbi:hypothetical protein BZA70DRAFT_265837 [Myxozyma melibiosi]|uniref:Cytochrome c oxidase assembly factor 3 n=1 Tax=Myxozyma melibiosi TaxID=54550 RepID=A0ABR1FFE1_9ASCO
MPKQRRNMEDLLRGVVEPGTEGGSSVSSWRQLQRKKKDESIWLKALGRNKKVYAFPLISIALTLGFVAYVFTMPPISKEEAIQKEIDLRYAGKNLTEEQKIRLALVKNAELDMSRHLPPTRE